MADVTWTEEQLAAIAEAKAAADAVALQRKNQTIRMLFMGVNLMMDRFQFKRFPVRSAR